MIGAALVMQDIWTLKGTRNVEEFDPDPFMEGLNKWGLPYIIERNPKLVD